MKKGFFIFCGIIFVVLIGLSEIFIDVSDFINRYITLSLVFITAVYAYTTYKMLQTSHIQNVQLQKQNEQLQKQHTQNIGYRILESQIIILDQVASNDLKRINNYMVEFLFDHDIQTDIKSLFNKWLQIKAIEQKIIPEISHVFGNDLELLEKFNRHIGSIPISYLLSGVDENIIRELERALENPGIEAEYATRIREGIAELVMQSSYFRELKTCTINKIRMHIEESIAF